jgi:hypothetical protein
MASTTLPQYSARPPAIPGITWACDVKSERVNWLWQYRLAVGEINEIISDEGMGKSCVGARITADATRGKLDGQNGVGFRVLVVAHEDSWTHTVKPRLQAAGADMNAVGFLQYPSDDGLRPVIFPDDTEYVRDAMSQGRAGMLYVDPLGSHIAAQRNSFDPDQIRIAVRPLAEAAHVDKFTVLDNRHTNRSTSTNARQRSAGSLGYRQATRLQMIFGRDPDAPEDDTRRMLVGSKANISAKARALRIKMETVSVDLEDGTTDEII